MKEADALPSYVGYRCPRALIAPAVWRSCRFALRCHDVAELRAARGILVTDETVRQWCHTFGQTSADALRRRRPRPGDTWPLDAVFIRITGRQHSRWRAVDQDGQVLAILGQARRDQQAAAKFLCQRLTGLASVPRVVLTDTRASDGAAL